MAKLGCHAEQQPALVDRDTAVVGVEVTPRRFRTFERDPRIVEGAIEPPPARGDIVDKGVDRTFIGDIERAVMRLAAFGADQRGRYRCLRR